jgi:DNA-binding FadR family transcriptional regulator
MNIPILLARKSLFREVAEIVSREIASGKFPKNSYLPPERELCKTFGVSRTVIREATQLLESHGLVQVERGKGIQVVDSQEKHLSRSIKRLVKQRGYIVEHLMEFRHILEVAVAGLAADRRTPTNIATMKRWLAVMHDKPGEPEGYVDADVEFHNEIVRATQNPTILLLLEPISDLLRESRIASFSGVTKVSIRTKQHEEILSMIEQGNAEGARLVMDKHLSDTMGDLTRRSSKRASLPPKLIVPPKAG